MNKRTRNAIKGQPEKVSDPVSLPPSAEERSLFIVSLEGVDERTFEKGWKYFTEFGIGERHFNELQSTYRNLASTWLLGAFAAIGYVITQNLSIAPPTLIVAAIGIVASIGILMLWNIDLLVYHRLLDAYFTEGLRIERAYPWLPRVRTNMVQLHGNKGILPRVVWFYLMAELTLLIVSGIALGIWASSYGVISVILLLSILLVYTLLTCTWMYRSTSRIDSFNDVT